MKTKEFNFKLILNFFLFSNLFKKIIIFLSKFRESSDLTSEKDRVMDWVNYS